MRLTLAFSRDARHLAVPSPHGLDIVSVAGAPTVTIPGTAIDAFALVGDEVWIADAGVVPTMRRVRLDGTVLAERLPLWGLPGEGRFRRLSTGTGALWTASPPAVLVLDGDRPSHVPIPGNPEFVLPVSATRWLVSQQRQLALREPSTERWTSAMLGAGTLVDGAVIFDGRSAALVLETPSTTRDGEPLRQLVVIGLHEPVVQHRLTLTLVDQVRFAPRRGYALLLAARRRLLLIDLRFGRVIKEHTWDRDIVDLAIDDTAQHVGLLLGDDSREIVHLSIRDLIAATPTAPLAEPSAEDDAAPVEPVLERTAAPAPPPADAPVPAAGFHHGTPLGAVDALSPRLRVQSTSPAESLAVLERYRGLVTALLGRSIALAWDEGRLTYPNEGTHPFRSEVEGLLGRSTGHATDDLRSAELQVSTALRAIRATESAAASGGRTTPLLALAREFGMSPLAGEILLVVSAPGLWGNLARLFGILANDEARPLCDEMLVCQILGPRVNPHDVARELDRTAPLVRYGMIRPGEGRLRPFVALSVEPLVLRLLRGIASEGDLEDVEVIHPTVSFEDLLIPATVKERVVSAVAAPMSQGRIVIRGRVGSGRHTLLATLAAAAGRNLGVIDAAPILRDLKNRIEHLRAALKRAQLYGLLPAIDGLESIASDDLAARDTVAEALRQHPGPLAIRLPWDARPPLDSGYLAIDLPALTIDQRLTAWSSALGAHHLYVRNPVELATRYSIGPGVIIKACAQVANAAAPAHDAEVAEPRDVAPELETAVRQHLESRLGTTATRVTRFATWSQVVLPPDIQDSLLELIARIKHRRTVFDLWGFDRVMSTSRGVTALFQGGPGTGKTLVATAIANELGMDLYRVDLSRVMSKWIGETEQNLAKLFDAAEDGHAIVLFDEADSLFAKRTEVRTSVDRYANLEVNYLLQRLDSFEGIAILTSNFGTAIDAAFKRRLSFRLTFPFPDEEMREQLWKAHLPPDLPVAGDFDFAGLARRYRMSGGYIRNATLRAAFLAAEEQTAFTQDHLERAIRAEFREIGKLADSGVLE